MHIEHSFSPLLILNIFIKTFNFPLNQKPHLIYKPIHLVLVFISRILLLVPEFYHFLIDSNNTLSLDLEICLFFPLLL